MKFINPVLLVSDEATGKAYARQLSPWEQNLVLQQLQALDGGALKMTEIAPVIVRGVNVSEERARQIVEASQQQYSGRGFRRNVYRSPDITQQSINARINAKLPPSLVEAMREPCECITDFRGQCVDCGQPLPKVAPVQNPCPHEWTASEGRTASGYVCRLCGDYDGPFTERNYNPEKYQK